MQKSNRKYFLSLALMAPPFLTFVLPITAQPKRSVKGGSWVELQASTDKRQYVAGEPVRVTLKATNIQQKDAYLKFSSGQRFDFKLFKLGQEEPVYTWSANKNFLMATRTVKLKMAQRETHRAEIGGEMGELTAGQYRLEAHLTNSSQVRALPIEFSIVPKPVSTSDKRATLVARTDKRVYQMGEAVKVDFSLQNNPFQATTFDFRSGQNYDVFIKNAAGEPVWNWAANKRFIMVSRPITLAAGQKQDFSVEWNGQALPDRKITPGKYTVQAVYASFPEIYAAPVTIEIR